jgi:RNA 3'-terminal phosphate cyclase (ATP)
VKVGSREFSFAPGARIKGGDFAWDIGTAGSTTMLALSMLPLACFADRPVTARITGGIPRLCPLATPHAACPPALAPAYGRGDGTAGDQSWLCAQGCWHYRTACSAREAFLHALTLTKQGLVGEVSGVASPVTWRRAVQRAHGPHLRRVPGPCRSPNHPANGRYDCTARRRAWPWAETSTRGILGADRAGAVRRSSEAIGRFVAEMLLADLATGATVDRHLADQLVLFAALADGTSAISCRSRPHTLLAISGSFPVWGAGQFPDRRSRSRSGLCRQHGSP